MKLFIRALIIGDIDGEQVPEIAATSLDSFSHNPFVVFADGWEIEVGTTSDLRGDATWQPGIERSTYYLDCWPESELSWQEIYAALDKLRHGFEAAGTRLAWQLIDQLAE
ncbi:hypothetical protein RMN57_28690 [Kitasatospora sp. CM 4170]|uniref:Integron gene cassette protein n=1 Tax=Kitasatospora aburaviensis TaxID=67265 RepID=A0ABW1ENL2_9ACTN|nr:hypothetical protein [Kitasatospora sp. CM 4170]WNM48375.1 hypothetical protein RMN57_28690 [Kitasatospora sp. CM 4170]